MAKSKRWFGVMIVCLGAAGCGGGGDGGPSSTISLTPTTSNINDTGEMTTLNISVTSEGVAGTGDVMLSAPAGSFGASAKMTTVTLANGMASVPYSCTLASDAGCTGNVTITARWTNRVTSTIIRVGGGVVVTDGGMVDAQGDSGIVSGASWVSTRCGGANCTIMGIKNSGFNESAQVTFRFADSANNPIQNAAVTFTIMNPPAGTMISPTTTTNMMGLATANVTSGLNIGVFTVRAETVAGGMTIAANSPDIGIRGAKTANEGFRLSCTTVNIPAHVAPAPPRVEADTCLVVLVDRYNNPVGTGTSVNFKSEAGTIPNNIATKAYDPATSNVDEGRATVTFSTAGTYPPVDVPPYPAAAGQFPRARVLEPSRMIGALTLNPRDSLVTVIAYLRGEEKFFDDNANGTRDTAERFIDQPEAFVDANDNGTWDVGETYIDDAPANGRWDNRNGTWDADTTIWTETRLLYSDRPVQATQYSFFATPTFAAACPGGLAKGASVIGSALFRDQYFNIPVAAGTMFTSAHTATKGMAATINTNHLDGYGFAYERRLVNVVDQTDCLTATPICEWKPLFYEWESPIVGVRVTGASAADITACQDDTVSASVTVLGVTTSVSMTGGIL